MSWTLTFEHKVGAAHDACGARAAPVVSTGEQTEGGVFAGRVRVVIVVTLPCVVAVVEDEVSREEQDLGPDLAATGRPLTAQGHRQLGPRRENGRLKLVWARDDPTDDAAEIVILRTEQDLLMSFSKHKCITWESSLIQLIRANQSV